MTIVRTLGAAAWICALATTLPFDLPAADLDIEQLRRDVRELERTVAAQNRRIEQLERQVGREAALTGTGTGTAPVAPNEAAWPEWLAADRWRGLENGMTTQQVLEILGPPTAVRVGASPEERLMLYTLELDASAFLSGTVRIRDDRVVAVEQPKLK